MIRLTVMTVSLIVSSVPVAASEDRREAATPAASTSTAGDRAASARAVDVSPSRMPWVPRAEPPVQVARPKMLVPLYVSLAALEVFDGYTTTQGLARGAQEANPMMQSAATRPAVFWSVKAATTVAPMLAAERMWHRNRAGAIVLMVVTNGAMAAVAANNARVVRQLR